VAYKIVSRGAVGRGSLARRPERGSSGGLLGETAVNAGGSVRQQELGFGDLESRDAESAGAGLVGFRLGKVRQDALEADLGGGAVAANPLVGRSLATIRAK
jgi:hypothetical protein